MCWYMLIDFPAGRSSSNGVTVPPPEKLGGPLLTTSLPLVYRNASGRTAAPQFSAMEFRDLLTRWGVEWIPPSPTYAQSNGHAEAAVKAVKHLVLKAAPSGDLASEEFLQGLLELRNTPGATGFSSSGISYER